MESPFIRRPKHLKGHPNVPNSPSISIKGVCTFLRKLEYERPNAAFQPRTGYIATRSHFAHLDEFIYSGQVTLPEESDQLRLHRHSASAPGATLLTLTSSSTLDRSRYLRSQISSGYISTRLHRHSASTPGAMLLTLTSSSTLDRSRYLRS